jgi:hypothetical protein
MRHVNAKAVDYMNDSKDVDNSNLGPLRGALERVRPEMMALKETELLAINLNPLKASIVARGAIPDLMELRPEFIERVVGFEIRNLDLLETYARALIQAHVNYLAQGTTSKVPEGLFREALELRSLDRAALDRRRAYTLLVRAYNAVRHAVAILRAFYGDADRIAPPLRQRCRYQYERRASGAFTQRGRAVRSKCNPTLN